MPAELFSYFEVESTTYEKQVFCLFDEGMLYFMGKEFLKDPLKFSCDMLSKQIYRA